MDCAKIQPLFQEWIDVCEKEFENGQPNISSFAFRVNNSIIGALSRLSSYLIVCSHFHLWFLMKIEIWETYHLLES